MLRFFTSDFVKIGPVVFPKQDNKHVQLLSRTKMIVRQGNTWLKVTSKLKHKNN